MENNEDIQMQYDPALDPDGTKAAAEAECKARKEMMASMPGMMAESAAKRTLNEMVSQALPDEVNRLRWAGLWRNIPVVSDIVQWWDNVQWVKRMFGK